MSLVGEQQSETIDIVNVTVKYPDGQSGTQEYDAPSGLGIVSYKELPWARYGNTGWSFDLIGDKSVFIDDRNVDSNFQKVYDVIEKENKKEYQSRIDELKKEAVKQSRITASTNSKLITHWHCKHAGNDFDRKGGGLHLGVEIHLIRGLTSFNIEAVINKLIDAIRRGKPPQKLSLDD